MTELSIADRLYGGGKTTPAAAEAPKADDASASIAERLYGKTTPATDETAAALEEGATGEKPAEKPADQAAPEAQVPDNIREVRKNDVERKLYSTEKMYAAAGVEEGLGDIPDTEFPPEHRAVVARELEEIMRDVGLEAPQATEAIALCRRHGPYGPEPVTAEMVQSWAKQTKQELERVYGKDVDSVYDAVGALVLRDPRLHAMLANTGMGTHPRIFLTLAERARAARAAGRL